MDYIDNGHYFSLTLLQTALILMWLGQDPKQPLKKDRLNKKTLLNGPFEIQMTNAQTVVPNFAKKPQTADIPLHAPNNPKDLQNSQQRSWNKSFTIHPINGEPSKHMIQTIKLTQARMTEIKKECRPDCLCKACLSLNLAQKNRIQNMKEALWSGPLIIHPNTDKYRMEKATLTYQGLLDIPLDKNLTKIKYLADKDLYVPVIKLTHGQAQTRLLPNRKEGIFLFIQIMLGYLAVHESFWTKYLVNDEAQGLIYRKYSLKGQWERITVTIRRGTLKENAEEQRKFSSQCLWSSFKVIQWQMPHVIIKLWDGMWKVEYGLPITRLSQWLSAFLSLISIQ